MQNYHESYEFWKNSPLFDDDTRREVSALQDEKEIEDRFYRDLAFGTGGMRGIMGAGPNRMNRYTVGKATQGLANYLCARFPNPRVAIAYDSRINSRAFALEAACILAANSVKCYLFEDLRPTPELSFAVRHYKTDAGIVITASHNPPRYNGYKVYSSSGGQIVPPEDQMIIKSIENVRDFSLIRKISAEEAQKNGLLEFLGEETDRAYLAAVKSLLLNRECAERAGKELKIVYTPLNGAGNLLVRRILKETGFENVYVVPEQEAPDGNFPTLEFPNPEDPKAFALALSLAREKEADLVLATDPDADRLGVYARDESGDYMPFTGNMSGILIADYLLSQREQRGLLPKERKKGALVSTIVSTDMAKSLAKAYGLTYISVLTGFKYIGEQMNLFEASGEYEFEFGFEESYGCLAGTHALDKDAVTAVALLCEAAAYYKEQGKTLCTRMGELYEQYGYFREGLLGFTLAGAEGAEKIERMIKKLRENPPKQIGGARVTAISDYKTGKRIDLSRGEEAKLSLPQSNVLYFELEGESWVCVRPSGTEPKIKFYFGVKGTSKNHAEEKLKALENAIKELTAQ